jgi:hypothetical protein
MCKWFATPAETRRQQRHRESRTCANTSVCEASGDSTTSNRCVDTDPSGFMTVTELPLTLTTSLSLCTSASAQRVTMGATQPRHTAPQLTPSFDVRGRTRASTIMRSPSAYSSPTPAGHPLVSNGG